jgi:ParB-like chromosome segregation protein Spo0J
MIKTKDKAFSIQIINRKISELIHPAYNPRRISKEDQDQLKKSLTEFSCVEPAVINQYPGRENIIIGGNQRVYAAEAMGWKEFPCIEVSLIEKRERELNIRLNRNKGEWDFKVLSNEFDIELLKSIGFTEKELIKNTFQKNFTNNIESRNDLIKFPITVIANESEYALFNKIKEKLKQKTDKGTFFKLMEYFDKNVN